MSVCAVSHFGTGPCLHFFFFPLHHLLRAVDRSQCGQPAQAVGSGRGEFSPEEPLPP